MKGKTPRGKEISDKLYQIHGAIPTKWQLTFCFQLSAFNSGDNLSIFSDPSLTCVT